MKISDDESKALAGALIDLSKQYQIDLSPRMMAWINLIGAAGAIYGPRLAIEVAMQKAMTAQREQRNTIQRGQQSNAPQVLNPEAHTGPEGASQDGPFKMNFGGT